MTFKRLNKRRKIYFCSFLINGSIILSGGIILKNFYMGLLGLFMLGECLDMFNDQISDNIIDNYAEMFEINKKIHTQNLKTISNAIKENNPTRLKYITDALDSYYGKEENDDSNEGELF